MAREERSDRPSRPAVAGPVAVAAVFLAVIGASVGFVLGNRDGDPGSNLTGNGQDSGVEVTTEPGGGQDDSAPPPAPPDPEVTAPYPPDGGTPDGDHCPTQTELLARKSGSPGKLARRLYIRTDHSEVWICVDPRGVLFYQGHRGKPGERLVEGQNALFLTDVSSQSGGYRAVNRIDQGDTVYHVSAAELVIERKGERQTEPVVEQRP